MNQTARREQLASSFFLPIFAAFSLRICAFPPWMIPLLFWSVLVCSLC